MPLRLGSFFFPPTFCFPVMSARFLLNKGKHAISHNGTFSSVVCPWTGVLAYLLVYECVCVCLGGMKHSRGSRPEMGRVLLSSLNYLARGGACGSTPALASTGNCTAKFTAVFSSFFYERMPTSVVLYSGTTHTARLPLLAPSLPSLKRMNGNRRNLSGEIDWKLIWPHVALFNLVISFYQLDRGNKGCAGGGVRVNVWCFLLKLLTALQVSSPVKWFGVFSLLYFFFLKRPPKDGKLRRMLWCESCPAMGFVCGRVFGIVLL